MPNPRRPAAPKTKSSMSWLWGHIWSWIVVWAVVGALWGFAGIALGMNEFTLAKRLFFCGNLLLLAKVVTWPDLHKRSLTERYIVILVAVVVIGGLTWYEFWWAAKMEAAAAVGTKTTPTISSTPPVPTAIFINCRSDFLPIRVAAHSTAHVMRLHPKLGFNWGFYDVTNHGNKELEWPPKTEAISTSKFNTGVFIYGCDVSNHAPSLVLDVAIKFSIQFYKDKMDEDHPALYGITHTAILNPLDPGSTFTFYLVNQCPLFASTIMPDTAVVQALGESSRRTVPLKRLYRDPVEPFIALFPSYFRWSGVPPCVEKT